MKFQARRYERDWTGVLIPAKQWVTLDHSRWLILEQYIRHLENVLEKSLNDQVESENKVDSWVMYHICQSQIYLRWFPSFQYLKKFAFSNKGVSLIRKHWDNLSWVNLISHWSWTKLKYVNTYIVIRPTCMNVTRAKTILSL